jgi:hypothetical protein
MARSRERRPRTRGPGFVLDGESGFRLELSVSGYQFPGERYGADADWLICSVELRDGPRLRARIHNDPFLEGRDLRSFRDELVELLAGRSDRAELTGIEDTVTLEIERRGESLHLAAAVTNHGDIDVELDGVTVGTDVLERVVADLAQMLDEFPSRPEHVERRQMALPQRPSLGDFLRRRDR